MNARKQLLILVGFLFIYLFHMYYNVLQGSYLEIDSVIEVLRNEINITS